jgi:hypothetical protein
MASDHGRNLENRTLKEYDSRKCLQAEGFSSSLSQGQSMSGRALCVVRIVCTESMNDFLMWSDTPKHKGRYRLKDKHFLKDAEEKGKEVWKRRCEEAKQEKKNKGLKYTAQRRLFT